MKKDRFSKYFLLLPLFVTCSIGNSYVIKSKLGGNYVLFVDKEQKEIYDSVYYSLGEGNFIACIDAPVLGSKSDKNFITIKAKLVHSHKIVYYIIPLKDKINKSPDLNKYGPLENKSFNRLCRNLNISHDLIDL